MARTIQCALGLLLALLALAGVLIYAKAGSPKPKVADAQLSPRAMPQMLVDVDWLAGHLTDPSVVVLDIGEEEGYKRSHIPGAQFLDYESISTPRGEGLTLELAPIPQLVSTFEKVGVSNQSHIVLYFHSDWVTPTTRVYWTLDYIGLGANTAILDGGYPAWRAANRPTSGEVNPVTSGKIIAHPRNEIVADADWTAAHLNQRGTDVIDARAPEYYTGSRGDGTPRSGHIPGATNLPYTSVVGADDRFKSKDVLEKLFRAAGVKSGDQVVSYCHIGQRATVIYFTAKYLGYDARMYDGSWEDWSQRTNLPIVTGSAPGTVNK